MSLHETSPANPERWAEKRAASKRQPRCSRCGERPRREGQRYCLACHAAANRAYRKRLRMRLAEAEKARSNV